MRTTGIMEVTLVGARRLKNTELFGKVDPYVVIRYKNEEQKSTSRRSQISKFRLRCCVCARGQGSSSPAWNQKFKFRVDHEHEHEHEQHKLILKLMDRDTFTDDDKLGIATIYLKELFAQGMEDGKAELGTQKYRVVSSNQMYCGEIQVGVTFNATLN